MSRQLIEMKSVELKEGDLIYFKTERCYREIKSIELKENRIKIIFTDESEKLWNTDYIFLVLLDLDNIPLLPLSYVDEFNVFNIVNIDPNLQVFYVKVKKGPYNIMNDKIIVDDVIPKKKDFYLISKNTVSKEYIEIIDYLMVLVNGGRIGYGANFLITKKAKNLLLEDERFKNVIFKECKLKD